MGDQVRSFASSHSLTSPKPPEHARTTISKNSATFDARFKPSRCFVHAAIRFIASHLDLGKNVATTACGRMDTRQEGVFEH